MSASPVLLVVDDSEDDLFVFRRILGQICVDTVMIECFSATQAYVLLNKEDSDPESPSPDILHETNMLWAGNGFVMPQKKSVAPIHGSRMHLIAPSVNRGAMRSVAPKGFAQAVF